MECNEVWEGEIGRNGELVEFEKVILEKIILMECNEVEMP